MGEEAKVTEISNNEEMNKRAKEEFKKVLDECDGAILFVFKNEEKDGQKIPKSMVSDAYGLMAFGNSNFHYARKKLDKVIDEIHKAEDEQKAALSE